LDVKSLLDRYCLSSNVEPVVNRQSGFRRGDSQSRATFKVVLLLTDCLNWL